MLKRKTKQLVWYIIISIPMFVLLAFVSGVISEAYPNNIQLFGLPFDVGSLVFWVCWMVLTIILVLFFPKTKKRGEL